MADESLVYSAVEFQVLFWVLLAFLASLCAKVIFLLLIVDNVQNGVIYWDSDELFELVHLLVHGTLQLGLVENKSQAFGTVGVTTRDRERLSLGVIVLLPSNFAGENLVQLFHKFLINYNSFHFSIRD